MNPNENSTEAQAIAILEKSAKLDEARRNNPLINASIDIKTAFEQAPPELDFIFPGFLAGTVGTLIAPGATGKSFWALEAAISIAACDVTGQGGGDLLGLHPKQSGKVLYLAGEDTPPILQTRLHAIGSHLRSDARALVQNNLTLTSTAGMGLDLFDKKSFETIEIAGTGKRLVILDTISRFHKREENSNGEMAALVGRMETLAKKTGAAILYLHHTSKNAAINGLADLQQAARGASALVDNARFAAFVCKMTETESQQYMHEGQTIAESRGFYLRYGVAKQNYGMPEPDKWFRREQGGVLLPPEYFCEIPTKQATTPQKGKNYEQENRKYA